MDKKERALELLLKANELQLEGKYDEAIDIYHLSINIFPTAEAYISLGKALSFKGDFDLAISECKKALTINPDYGNSYNDIGYYLMVLGNSEEALYWFDLALKCKNYDEKFITNFYIGKIMEKLNEWDEAIFYYNRSIELNKEYIPPYVALNRLKSWKN